LAGSSEITFSLRIPATPEIGQIILDRGFSYFVETVKQAEKLGFHAVLFPDHFMRPETNVMYETWTAIAALALQTKNIRLGSSVTPVPFHHPGILAKRIATVDHISKGRTIFGAGSGWIEREFKAYGIRFDSFRTRTQKFLEGIEVIKALWTTEGPVNYNGKYYTIENVEFLPKPTQKPHPPIWLGGCSPQILKAVSEHGQGWIPHVKMVTPETLKAKIGLIKKLVRKVGRDPKDIVYALAIQTVVGTDSKKVEARIKGLSLGSEEIHKIVYGTPKNCITEISKYLKLGVTHISIDVLPAKYTVEDLQLYSEKVIPYLVD